MKVAVISGGTSGVGKKTAQDLANRGIHVILLGRNVQKGQAVKEKMIATSGNHNIDFLPVDLTCKDEITKAVHYLTSRFPVIDILVNAAGVLLPERIETKDGYDQNFVTNYLAHYQLTSGLLQSLNKAKQGRILFVGALPFAINHSMVKLPSIESRKPYKSFTVVQEALVARVLLTKALTNHLKETNVTANIFHPGYITDSDYGAGQSKSVQLLGKLMGNFSLKNPTIGADLATDEKFANQSGQLFSEKGKPIALSRKYTDELAEDLLQFSESL